MNELALIADNPVLFDALKALLRKQFSLDNLTVSLTNEDLGQRVRSRLDGLMLLEKAFIEIAAQKTGTQAKEPVNRAR